MILRRMLSLGIYSSTKFLQRRRLLLYACGSQRNYTGYCKEEMMKLFEKQSMMDNGPERMKLVYEIDKKLQEDAARPIIANNVRYNCFQPYDMEKNNERAANFAVIGMRGPISSMAGISDT